MSIKGIKMTLETKRNLGHLGYISNFETIIFGQITLGEVFLLLLYIEQAIPAQKLEME